MANTTVGMLAAGAGARGTGGEAGFHFQLFLVRVQLPRKLGGLVGGWLRAGSVGRWLHPGECGPGHWSGER